MTGDQADILARIKGQLPPWFGNGPTPFIDGVLSGAAWVLASIYTLYAYAALQTRIATATDGFLDMAAQDFFGTTLLRGDDDDDTFRRKIQTSIFRQKVTTNAAVAILLQLTGNTATVAVTGAYTATITIAAGSVDHAEVLAAVETIRPICSTLTTTFI